MLPPKRMRVNSFPSMAVDTTGGGKGIVYLVWADRRYGDSTGDGDSDILFIKSQTGGDTWEDTLNPIRINNDTRGNGRDQWFPWITVAPDQSVYVVFYDCRNDSNNLMTEVWVARHAWGAPDSVWENFRVSDVAFEPCIITAYNMNGQFTGDYIGIASGTDYVYPSWNDNRVRPPQATRGIHQAYVGVIPITGTSGTIASNKEWNLTTLLTGSVTINPGVTVTVKPGTKVLADTAGPPVCINVQGNLVIEGSGARPTFLSKAETPGGWYGIRVMSGGSVDWGDGCTIMDATVGVTVDDGADMTEICGVRVENTSTCGFQLSYLSDSIRLVNDTVVDVTSGKGIHIIDCNPVIDSSVIIDCSYGVYAVGSAGKVRNVTIEGPGTCGVYHASGGEQFDTLRVTGCNVTGYFSGAHVYAAASGHCRIDDCELISDTVGSRSLFGIFAGDGAWVRVRRTTIHEYDSTGVYSDNSNADLGVMPDTGYNSIWTSACAGSCDSSRVIHHFYVDNWGEGMLGGEGLDGGGGPPPPEPVALPAEGNWWGDDSPDSVWFVSTDYAPWLGSEPLGKRVVLVAARPPFPRSITVSQNYPNPFNAVATIEFSLPTAHHVQIKVFNVLGQVVRDLIDRDYPPGTHQVTWDGTDTRGGHLASGLYLYRIAAGDMVETRKMVLLK
ncbi:MAG: right-handed parallel beta-helix repeat-containing protein [Candidatus Zixiibacteriota bacterium]